MVGMTWKARRTVGIDEAFARLGLAVVRGEDGEALVAHGLGAVLVDVRLDLAELQALLDEADQRALRATNSDATTDPTRPTNRHDTVRQHRRMSAVRGRRGGRRMRGMPREEMA